MNNDLMQFNSNAVMNRFFRKVDGVVWDLMSGKVGIRTSDGIATLTKTALPATEASAETPAPARHSLSININPLESFSVPLPAFAQRTDPGAVEVGDLIHGAQRLLGWVSSINEKSFQIMKADGTHTTWSPPKVEMLGDNGGVMVVRSLLQFGGETGLGNLQGSLLPLMMLGGDKASGSLEKVLPMMLMMQSASGATSGAGMNAMMPLLMMQMMGGKSLF